MSMEQPDLFIPPSLTVSELALYLRRWIESNPKLQNLWVYGEVSNLAIPASGHVYFSLKEGDASVRCVIWKSSAARLLPLLQNGFALEAAGSISVYERDAICQLYVTDLRPVGEGRLFQEFLRLKALLEKEGLFDESRKRPLPQIPAKIGIVTSSSGAALQDILMILRHRYPLPEVVVAHTPVQGVDAPGKIVAALTTLVKQEQPDVIILARGGGSLEDLWAFNDERVVRAVAGCLIPVVSGVGHETDFSLVDFASDFRAPTPTGAAVAVSPDIQDWILRITEMTDELGDLMGLRLQTLGDDLGTSHDLLERNSPRRKVLESIQHVDELAVRSARSVSSFLHLRRERLDGISDRLYALDAMAVLKRGYAIVTREDGRVVKIADDIAIDEEMQIRLTDGKLRARRIPDKGGRNG